MVLRATSCEWCAARVLSNGWSIGAFKHDILGDLISGEKTAALHRTLRDLPERYRDVIVLCELEERSYEEVALLIGRPVGTVRSRLHRGRALLSAKLKRLNAPVEVFSR